MEQSFARTALFLAAGLLVWAADFLFIYVFAALACARGFDGTYVLGVGVVPFASAAATAVALALSAMLVVVARRGHGRRKGDARAFTMQAALAACALALIAIALTGMPGALVRGTCG